MYLPELGARLSAYYRAKHGFYVAGKNWFVGAASAGANTGTSPEDCWNAATFNSAHGAVVKPGDTIWLMDKHNPLSANHYLTMAVSGTAGNCIKIRGDYPGRPFHGMNLEGSNRCLFTNSQKHIYIYKAKISGFKQMGLVLAHAAYGSNDTLDLFITVEECEILDTGITNGVAAPKSIEIIGRDAVLFNSIVSGSGDDCVTGRGKRLVGMNNVISRPSLDTNNGDCFHTGYTGSETDGLILMYNDLDHTNKDTKHCVVNSGATDNPRGIIAYNRCRAFVGGTVGMSIYVETGSMLVMANGCSGGKVGIGAINSSVGAGQHLLIGNGIRDTSYAGMETGWGATNVTDVIMANNSLLNTGTYGVASNAQQETVAIINNIIKGCGKGIWRFNAAQTESNNCIHGATVQNSVTGGSATTVATPHVTDILADPLMNPLTYELAANSPCIGAGAGTKYWGTKPRPSGLDGEPFPDVAIDIGALQSKLNEFHPANL